MRTQLAHWQQSGTVMTAQGLWLFCLSTWVGMAFFTILSVPGSLRSDELELQFTLPISFATRFRTLYGSFFLKHLWLWSLLQLVVLGYVLISQLGWQGCSWLALLEGGVGLAVLVSLIGTLLLLRYVLAPRQYLGRTLVVIILLVATLVGMLCYSWLGQQGQEWVMLVRPELVLLLFFIIIGIALGPGAEWLGRLYAASFSLVQSKDRGRSTFTLPGSLLLVRVFARRRTLTGGLMVRSLLNQSRNWLFWLRLLLIWGLLALFPVVHMLGQRFGMSDQVLIAAYAATLACGHILETGPAVIGGEANRFALYLVAPFSFRQLLWSRLQLCLWPILTEGLLMGCLLAFWNRLAPMQLIWILPTISGIIIPCTCLMVWGGCWDLELNKSVEGKTEAMMLEEGPFTPRRLVLLNVSLLFLAALLFLLWWLPPFIVLPLLLVLAVAVGYGMYVWSTTQLQFLLRSS
ncbi:hypothetical protein [Dictyobacter kobayashii]|uniref:hypothetical protein n=1 Tax=Dictyobacter kobayashii TaxID=2014872 RepID=UPI000F81BBAE|nr:hypothetical protein [Dictyobacter kobayashii]